MTNNITCKAEQMTRENSRNRIWHRIVAIPAVLVMVVTSFVLILPAFALEGETYCGYEPHTHDESCYGSALTCGYEDGALVEGAEGEAHEHHHTELCYGEALVCTVPEHEHTDACYQAPAEPEDEAETENSVDNAVAAPVPQCDIPEHEHSEACYDEAGELVCGMEPHTHTIECLTPAETADAEGETETAEDAETETAAPETVAPEISDMVEIDEDLTPMELQTVKVFEDDKVRITATYDPDALPEGAEIRAYPITAEANREEFIRMLTEASVAMSIDEETGEITTEVPLVLYNIGFYVNDEEVEPQTPVDVKMEFVGEQENFNVGEDVTVVHFADDGTEILESETDSQNNAASFQTGSFSPFLFTGLFGVGPSTLLPDEIEEQAKLIRSTYMLASTLRENDLTDYLTEFSITHGNEVVDPDTGTLYNGETYTMHFTFSEDTVRQFKPDGNMQMVYPFPEGLSAPNMTGGKTKVEIEGETIFCDYWVQDGVLYIDLSNIGADRLETIRDLTLNVDLTTTLEIDEDGKVKFPIVGTTGKDYTVDAEPTPEVKKTAGELSLEGGLYRQQYQVEIDASHGPLKQGMKFEDALHLGSAYTNYSELVLQYTEQTMKSWKVTVQHADGTTTEYTANNNGGITAKRSTDGKSFTLDELPALERGEKMVVEYYAYMSQDNSDKVKQGQDFYKPGQKNDVAVSSDDPKFKVESEAQVDYNFKSLIKTGSLDESSSEIKWTVEFNDGGRHAYLSTSPDSYGRGGTPVTVTDTITEGDASFSSPTSLDLYIYDENGNKIGTQKGWRSVTPTDSKTLTYTMPTESELEGYLDAGKSLSGNYYLRVEYTTPYTKNNDVLQQSFTNEVKSQFRDNVWHSSEDKVTTGVPLGEVQKTIENLDENGAVIGDSIKFKVVVPNIPALGTEGSPDDYTPFRFEDYLRLYDSAGNKVAFVQNQPQNIEVHLVQDGVDTPLTNLGPTEPYYGKDGDKYRYGTDNGYRVRQEGGPHEVEFGRFLIVFNTDNIGAGDSDSQLYLTKNADLIVTYEIPLDALLYADEVKGGVLEGTLRDWLEQGYRLQNSARPHVKNKSYRDDVDYRNPKYNQDVVKTARILDNGEILYDVEFKNYYKDENGNRHHVIIDHAGQWKDVSEENTSSRIKNAYDETATAVFNELLFDDHFSSKYAQYLEYVPGSLYASVVDQYGNLCAQYQIPNFASTPPGELTATAAQFTQRMEDVEDFDGFFQWDDPTTYGNWSQNDHYKNLVEGLVYHIRRNSGYYNIHFNYKLRVTDETFGGLVQSSVPLDNEVTVTSGDYGGSDEFTVDYPTKLLSKEAEQDGTNNDLLHFTIKFNEKKQQLLPESAAEGTLLTMRDTMSENLKLLDGTLQILADGVDVTDKTEYSQSGQELVLKLKDKTSYVITYTAQITETGEKVNTSNTVTIDDYEGLSSEYKHNFVVAEVTSTGTGSTGTIKLLKRDKTDTDKPLTGAKFQLYIAGPQEGVEPRVGQTVFADKSDTIMYGGRTFYRLGVTEQNRNPVYVAGGTDGSVQINSGFFVDLYQGKKVTENKGGYTFLLVEIEPPAGYPTPTGDAACMPFYFLTKGTEDYEVVVHNGSITVYNENAYTTELPETGGEGTTVYTAGGLALLGAALWLYSRRHKAGAR